MPEALKDVTLFVHTSSKLWSFDQESVRHLAKHPRPAEPRGVLKYAIFKELGDTKLL